MSLTTFKNAGNCNFLAKVFRMNGTTFGRILMNVIDTISYTMYDALVTLRERKLTMEKLVDANNLFANYKCVRYASDVTFSRNIVQ